MAFFFPRSQVMERLTISVETNLFTIVSAPSATGKTSAVCNFLRISKYATVYVPLLPEMSAFQSLANIGIDLLSNKWSDSYDDSTIVILDDAQLRYAEGNFWKTLIKDLPVMYPNRVSRVRFIIICTYLLSNAYNVSPVEFQSLSRIENEDLILTRDDSIKLLTSKEIGLPFALHNYSNLLELMVNECAGHIGALRISVDYLAEQLKLSPTASERAAVDWFFRMELLRRMERCFGGLGSMDCIPSEEVDTILIQLLAGQVCSCVSKFPSGIIHLQKCGVLRNRVVIDDQKIPSDSFLLDQLQTLECLSLDDEGTNSKLNVEEVLLCNLSLQDESSSSILTSSLGKDPVSVSSNTHMPHSLLPPSMDDTELSFASPLAERYFSMHFYPDRGSENPSYIEELTVAAIQSMSAASLRDAVADSADFPNEATFQHLFMRGLTKNTRPTTQVLPELSKVLPVLPGGVTTKTDGRIDFFVNGDLRWGIELLIKGNRCKAHRERFAAGGKYVDLNCNAFIVVDLRPGPGALSQKMAGDSKDVMTVYFAENFQTSSVFYSSWTEPRVITLRK